MIDDVLVKLDPSLRKLLETGTNFHIQRQSTPSALMNKALKGGLAYGRQVLIWGSKSAGKSMFCLLLVAMAQKEGKTCAWIDAENSFDPEWARRLGVDTDALIVSRAHKVNDMVDIGTELMKAGVDILIVDSISALLPAVYFEKDGSLKDLKDTKQMGAMARDMANAVTMLNYSNDNTLLILISQQRNKLGSMFVSKTPTGGEAAKFFSSTIVRLFSSETERNAIHGTVKLGERDIEKVIGREVTWTVEANKLGPAFESGKYNIMFEGEEVGIDTAEELVSVMELYGLENFGFTKRGAWYYRGENEEEKWQGRPALVEGVRNSKSLRESIENVL